jgi:hypothetical protein
MMVQETLPDAFAQQALLGGTIMKEPTCKGSLLHQNMEGYRDNPSASSPPLLDLDRDLSGDYDVFISHTGAQKDFANSLYNKINWLTLRPFYDSYSLRGKLDNDKIMDNAAKNARVVVLLLSPEFVKKKWPLRELLIALDTGRYLPVWIGDSFDELKDELRMKPEVLADLLQEDWSKLVQKLEYATTIVKDRTKLTDELIDQILFLIVERCYDICLQLLKQERYISQQLNNYNRRVLEALKKVCNKELSSIVGWDLIKAEERLKKLSIELNP